jgi:tetratricopeptide (TPR) repeat protein
VLATNSKDVNALNNKGVALYMLGRYEEAISYFDKALGINPSDVDALNNKIAVLGKLTPNITPTSFSSNAYGQSRGYIYVSSSLHVTSVATSSDSATCETIQQLVQKGLKLQPNNIMILTNAGINLAQKCGKYEESITYYDRALVVNATYVPALYNKAVSLDKTGNHEEAQGLFDKAKELDPNYKTDFIVGAPRLAEPLPSPI